MKIRVLALGLLSACASTSVMLPTTVARLSITPVVDTIAVGGSHRLVAQAFTSADVPVTNVPIVWRSFNTVVATIDTDGTVHGISIGTADVTVTADNALVATARVVIVAK